MLGADVGTSLVTVVLSYDLSWLSPLLIFVGVVLFLARQSDSIGRFGRVLIGLGLIMFALQWISVAAKPVVQARRRPGDLRLADRRRAARHAGRRADDDPVLFEPRRRAADGHPRLAARASRFRWRSASCSARISAAASSACCRRCNSPPEARRVTLGNFLFKLIGCIVRRAVHRACRGADRGARASGRRRRSCCSTSPSTSRLSVAFIFFTAPIARIAERLLPAKPISDDPAQAPAPRSRRRSPRPRSRSRARRARRCASATSSSRC